MSKGEYLSVTHYNPNPPGYDGELLEIRVGSSSILIDSLHIRDTCNWDTPHEIVGLGHSGIMVTGEQLMKFLCEYMRFKIHNYDQDVKYTSQDCGSEFNVFIRKIHITQTK